MAPRADWKGFLRLSLVTCPIALYPATSDSEKISFKDKPAASSPGNEHDRRYRNKTNK
jgi:non-homologous end joining protein Ku